MKRKEAVKSILLGNGFNINFGGKAYSSQFIIKRIIFNARADKYDKLLSGALNGEQLAYIFSTLTDYANQIVDGKYDSLIPAEEQSILEDFKKRYSLGIEHYFDIGLEDWLFILRGYCLQDENLIRQWKLAKQGFMRVMLDAIFNDGHIQEIYRSIGSPVKSWLKDYNKIFTLNYDSNIEDLTKKLVYHLHGDFNTLASSENENTLWGLYRRSIGEESVVIPEFQHCFCNALLDYTGEHKFEIADAFAKIDAGLLTYEKVKDSFSGPLPEPINRLMQLHHEYPDLPFGDQYHFNELRELEGELHIVGMSPNNDGHIFRLIDESKISKVVFYFYSEKEKCLKLPIHQIVEWRDINEIWRILKAQKKRYNCVVSVESLQKITKFLPTLRGLSGDSATKEEIIAEMKNTPYYDVKKLCDLVKEEIDKQAEMARPVSESEMAQRFREVSRIALREGILPETLYILVLENWGSARNLEE